jgi:hypothetical protein
MCSTHFVLTSNTPNPASFVLRLGTDAVSSVLAEGADSSLRSINESLPASTTGFWFAVTTWPTDAFTAWRLASRLFSNLLYLKLKKKKCSHKTMQTAYRFPLQLYRKHSVLFKCLCENVPLLKPTARPQTLLFSRMHVCAQLRTISWKHMGE